MRAYREQKSDNSGEPYREIAPKNKDLKELEKIFWNVYGLCLVFDPYLGTIGLRGAETTVIYVRDCSFNPLCGDEVNEKTLVRELIGRLNLLADINKNRGYDVVNCFGETVTITKFRVESVSELKFRLSVSEGVDITESAWAGKRDLTAPVVSEEEFEEWTKKPPG